jgi:hypothetical protein
LIYRLGQLYEHQQSNHPSHHGGNADEGITYRIKGTNADNKSSKPSPLTSPAVEAMPLASPAFSSTAMAEMI